MERIRSLLVTRAGMLCNVTIDAASWRRFKPELTSFLAALPSSPVAQSSWQIGEGPSAEALIIPASVNYVGKGANLYRLGFKPSGEFDFAALSARSATSMPISCPTPRALARCSATSPAKPARSASASVTRLLGANVADFRVFADALAELTAYGQVVVLGSEQAIRAADARRP